MEASSACDSIRLTFDLSTASSDDCPQAWEAVFWQRKLYLQVGTKANADGAVTWGAAQTLYVQGDGQEPTKVNPGGAGRFVRLRFYSNEADVEWRVSGFEIYARAGGTS